MKDVTRAEAQRRAREWLRIEFADPEQTNAFESAKLALSAQNHADIPALIAIGEYAWVRAMLSGLNDADPFLRSFGAYFVASADVGFARASWPRVVAMLESLGDDADADTLRSVAIAAEAIGEREMAANLNAKASAAVPASQSFNDLISSTVYGMLGYAPDAPKGRLLLRPAIDPEWSSLNVRNIPIGDSLIDMVYSRNDDRMEFEIVQVAGAYPIRLIFEPVLATRVVKAFVDGTPANLDFRPHEDRIIIPVQIMLDDRRVVRFE